MTAAASYSGKALARFSRATLRRSRRSFSHSRFLLKTIVIHIIKAIYQNYLEPTYDEAFFGIILGIFFNTLRDGGNIWREINIKMEKIKTQALAIGICYQLKLKTKCKQSSAVWFDLTVEI